MHFYHQLDDLITVAFYFVRCVLNEKNDYHCKSWTLLVGLITCTKRAMGSWISPSKMF